MDKSFQHFKFTMVFLAPVVTLFIFNSLIFLLLEQYFFMLLNFFVFLCILTVASGAWNRFMDRFTSELKIVVDTADSINCSAQLIDLEVKRLMELQAKIDTPGTAEIMELLNHSRKEAEKGGAVGLAHLKLAKELVTICSQLKAPAKREVSETPLVMIDCILLNSDKIKSQMTAMGHNFSRPAVQRTKVRQRVSFVRPLHS